jgi:hypothetical protein
MIRKAEIISERMPSKVAVLDLSPTGALICLYSLAIVPTEILLRLPNGTFRRARRCWQRGQKVGLEFLDTVIEAPEAEAS